MPPEQIDVSALVLTGFDIKVETKPNNEPSAEGKVVLKPIVPGGGGQPPLPVYLRQVIARLNSAFGEATPLTDKVAFVNHVAHIVREDPNTMAQVMNNSRDVVMNANIQGSLESAVVHDFHSHGTLPLTS